MTDERQKSRPSAEDVGSTLQRILKSDSFVNSARLQDFLRYIVEEQMVGRGAQIKGKTIAVQVYERELDAAGSAQNLVRVEARRLRRALEEFYLHEGANERVIIRVEAGSYRPTIEFVDPLTVSHSATETELLSAKPSAVPIADGLWVPRRAALFAGICFCVLVFVVATSFFRPVDDVMTDVAAGPDTAKLAALRERSLASVQALNTANQTRGTFFPLFDVKRQTIALETYQHIVELDPALPSGYAGMAQVLALLSILNPDDEMANASLSRAIAKSKQALEIDPTDAWANAAHAWVLAVSGHADEALERARIAARLAPEDGHILDLVGMTGLLAGDVQLTAEASDPARPRTGPGRFGANNIWGVSQLILQNYDATIEVFSTSAQRGLPVSAPTLLLLATAYQQIGNPKAARGAFDEMKQTWPDFPADAVALRFFERHPETKRKIEDMLNALNVPLH